MSMRRIILASTSSARRELMDSLGLPYEALSPGVDEHVAEGISVKDAVVMLAERKAKAVSARFPDALVIGADQLVAFEGRALGKPPDRAAAKAQLAMLSGKSHDIITGLCVTGGGFHRATLETARMTLYPLTDAELERYLDTSEWEGCAGAYRVEGKGQALFSAIDGDRTNVQGLPMLSVVRLLREAGISFF